jgi:hypothetical protein
MPVHDIMAHHPSPGAKVSLDMWRNIRAAITGALGVYIPDIIVVVLAMLLDSFQGRPFPLAQVRAIVNHFVFGMPGEDVIDQGIRLCPITQNHHMDLVGIVVKTRLKDTPVHLGSDEHPSEAFHKSYMEKSMGAH